MTEIPAHACVEPTAKALRVGAAPWKHDRRSATKWFQLPSTPGPCTSYCSRRLEDAPATPRSFTMPLELEGGPRPPLWLQPWSYQAFRMGSCYCVPCVCRQRGSRSQSVWPPPSLRLWCPHSALSIRRPRTSGLRLCILTASYGERSDGMSWPITRPSDLVVRVPATRVVYAKRSASSARLAAASGAASCSRSSRLWSPSACIFSAFGRRISATQGRVSCLQNGHGGRHDRWGSVSIMPKGGACSGEEGGSEEPQAGVGTHALSIGPGRMYSECWEAGLTGTHGRNCGPSGTSKTCSTAVSYLSS